MQSLEHASLVGDNTKKRGFLKTNVGPNAHRAGNQTKIKNNKIGGGKKKKKKKSIEKYLKKKKKIFKKKKIKIICIIFAIFKNFKV